MKKGDLVISKKGRDRDKVLVITETDEMFVWLCDGTLRKQDKPKKKKKKHVKETGCSDSRLCEKMAKGMKLTNADFRKAILDYMSANGQDIKS